MGPTYLVLVMDGDGMLCATVVHRSDDEDAAQAAYDQALVHNRGHRVYLTTVRAEAKLS